MGRRAQCLPWKPFSKPVKHKDTTATSKEGRPWMQRIAVSVCR